MYACVCVYYIYTYAYMYNPKGTGAKLYSSPRTLGSTGAKVPVAPVQSAPMATEASVLKVGKAYAEGFKQYNEYIELPLNRTERSIHDIISRNNFKIFNAPVKMKSKTKLKIDELRRDFSLFCKMYIASQNREADVEIFSHM